MSRIAEKFLQVYSISTLRDTEFLGIPGKNALLRFDDVLQKWAPTKLSVNFLAAKRNPSQTLIIEEDEFLIMKEPDIGSNELIIEGYLDII